jgi:hypothetical protein
MDCGGFIAPCKRRCAFLTLTALAGLAPGRRAQRGSAPMPPDAPVKHPPGYPRKPAPADPGRGADHGRISPTARRRGAVGASFVRAVVRPPVVRSASIVPIKARTKSGVSRPGAAATRITAGGVTEGVITAGMTSCASQSRPALVAAGSERRQRDATAGDPGAYSSSAISPGAAIIASATRPALPRIARSITSPISG